MAQSTPQTTDTTQTAMSGEREDHTRNEKDVSTLAGSEGSGNLSDKEEPDLEQQKNKKAEVSESDKTHQPQDPGHVPRSQARGILARLCLIPEVERPLQYSNGKKWTMTLIVSLASATSSTGSAIFYRKPP